MKKGEYYVLCAKYDGTEKAKDFYVETRKGYIDTELNIGYSCLYADGSRLGHWNATDLNSGFIMATADTKKECIEKAIKNIPLVNEKWMGDDKFNEMVEIFKRLKLEKECGV